MFDPCRAFRDDWFEREARDQGPLAAHFASCAECHAWSERIEQREARLAALPAQAAPDALDNAVWGEIAFPEVRLARALGSLERLRAPDELDALVAAALQPGERVAASVQALGQADAPHVLERLVREELADPEAHRVRRFVGGLEPVAAPGDLEARVTGVRTGTRLRVARRSLVGALALVTLGFFVARSIVGERERPVHRLPLVVAQSADELDPLARDLALALGGLEEAP